MLVLGPDGKSVRVFLRRIGGNTLEFYARNAANRSTCAVLESPSLSEWSFDGCASIIAINVWAILAHSKVVMGAVCALTE